MLVDVADDTDGCGVAPVVEHADACRDAAAVGVIGDVYEHEDDGESTFLRATGTRGRWMQDGHLEVIVAEAATSAAFAGPTGSFEPVQTDTERTLATMLAEALEVDEIGRNDNFFALGGDSIMAVQLAARARDAGISLTARMVFEHPAIHELAAAVDNTDGESESADAHHEPMAASGLSDDELAAVTEMFSASQDGAP